MTYLVRRGSPRVRLQLETLEARTTPSTSAYVAGLYVNLLGRVATAGEVAFWAQAINQGVAPVQVTSAFTSSAEFGANLVRLNYATLLGRVPGPAELNTWLTLASVGLTDDQLEAAILGSAEYYARNGSTNATWLAAVYRDELGRALDPTGATAWQQQLQLGISRAAVARQIVGSSEAHTLTVRTVYAQLLGRALDASGQTFWVSQLDAGFTLSRFLAQVAASAEYIQRTSLGGLDRPLFAAARNNSPGGVQALTEAPPPNVGGSVGSQALTSGQQSRDQQAGGILVAGSPLLNSVPGTIPGFDPTFFGLDPTFFALTGIDPFTSLLPLFSTGLPAGGFSTLGAPGVGPLTSSPSFSTAGFAPGGLSSLGGGFSPLNVPAFGSNTFVAVVIGFLNPTSAGFPGFGTTGFGGNAGTLTLRR